MPKRERGVCGGRVTSSSGDHQVFHILEIKKLTSKGGRWLTQEHTYTGNPGESQTGTQVPDLPGALSTHTVLPELLVYS